MRKTLSLIRLFFLACLIGLPVLKIQADIILTSTAPHATGPTHEFWEAVGFSYSTDTFDLSFPDSTAHLASDSRVSITLDAPAGQMFVVQTPPVSYAFTTFDFYVTYSDELNPPYATVSNPSLSFDLVSGSAPFLEDGGATIPIVSGNELDIWASASVASDFSFTRMTFTFDYNNTGLTDAQLSNFNLGILSYTAAFEGSERPDPGPLMTFASIPEPSQFSLIVISLLAAISSRRALGFCRNAS